MRECWINVYWSKRNRIAYSGWAYISRQDAIKFSSTSDKPLYRIHVRIK